MAEVKLPFTLLPVDDLLMTKAESCSTISFIGTCELQFFNCSYFNFTRQFPFPETSESSLYNARAAVVIACAHTSRPSKLTSNRTISNCSTGSRARRSFTYHIWRLGINKDYMFRQTWRTKMEFANSSKLCALLRLICKIYSII